ncbi:two-component system, NtrC family, sensor kinase [Anaerolineae bacterium]|nr:two-component system, NtrC family, sensor kinase [Anaerolineae bacterium]
MNAVDPQLVERLAGVRVLKGVPREELEWVAAHGEFEAFAAGTIMRPHNIPIPGMSVLLKGMVSIHVERGGVKRRVMEWHAGDLTGALPYSRMTVPPGNTIVHEDVELFTVAREHFRELTITCPELTAICVHTMLDRARHFTSTGSQDEKMVSLGKFSAGLAHELNNPASAAARSSRRLGEQMGEAEDASRALMGMRLSDAQLAALDGARQMCTLVPPSFLDTPLDRSDRVDAIAEWLDARGGDIDQATSLAETAVTVEGLDRLAAVMTGESLQDALRWLASCCAVRSAASELQDSTRRISELVASVKGFTYMGRASVPEPVNVGRGLRDTARIVASKARDKNVTVALDIEPDLPEARAFGSELNQIWINLIENAIDAVPYGGQVTLKARREIDQIVVRIVDDGHGIPEDIRSRIFDPFFTTKPVGEGTGMGLDIVRRMVFQQGGEIDFTSEPGRTEFWVALPIAGAMPPVTTA